MNLNRHNHRLYTSYSLDYGSNNKQNYDEEDDSISLTSLNNELTNGLYYLSSNLTTLLNSRQTSNKNLKNSIIPYRDSSRNGFIVNGLLFDEQLFQPIRSSYIIDYSKTPQDLNQFLKGHHLSSSTSSSQLDAHLYKLVLIITLSEWSIDKECLLDCYPQSDDDLNILEEISHYKSFCFPELNSLDKNGGQLLNDQSTYVFTRTLSNGQVEYGYCKRIIKEYNQITKYPIVICIVSNYAYFKLYNAILNELIRVYRSNEIECNGLMQSFYSKPLPLPTVNSSGITCILNDGRLFFYVCPYDLRLNHDYYSTLLSCLSASQIVYLFESMLRSKRILVYSSHPSKLTKSCLALSLLIYPFIWPFPFVSLMPTSWLHDLLDSPCPFIYGCLYETRQQIPLIEDNDIIHVDLDLNTVDGDHDTSYLLPLNLRQTLESSLEYLKKFRLTKLNSNLINIAVSEACLNVFIELFHRLPEFFTRQNQTIETDQHFSICTDYFKYDHNEKNLQSLTSDDFQQINIQENENSTDYEFRSDDFLRVQPTSSYTLFLEKFINGMIFLKFLDDYQRNDEHRKEYFSLFSQRLNERRQLISEDLLINPYLRFRQTIDLLNNHTRHSTKSTNPSFSRFLKKIFE